MEFNHDNFILLTSKLISHEFGQFRVKHGKAHEFSVSDDLNDKSFFDCHCFSTLLGKVGVFGEFNSLSFLKVYDTNVHCRLIR